jgi:hypothetical protein
MRKLQKQQIAQKWVEFAKGNFYHTQFPENQHYAQINDAQWNTFGYIMSYLTENWEYPTPTGTEERQWYRAFAAIVTGGKPYCKKVANNIINGKSKFFSNDYHVLEMFPFLDKILNK